MPQATSTAHTSRLARLQQIITLGLPLLAGCWLVWAPTLVSGLLGAGALLAAYAGVLGIEMVAAALINRRDPVPSPSLVAWLAAWWEECREAPLVFSWRQPFRWRVCPDNEAGSVPTGHPYRALVLVHGFVCNRGFWLPWMRECRRLGIPFVSVNLEPVFGSLEHYPPLLEAAIRRATALTGQAPVLVCHSMGGLVARAWAASQPGAAGRVAHVITIGSPHHGTWLGQFSFAQNGQQMRQNSRWLHTLHQNEMAQRPQDTFARFTCWYSNTDNIVMPASSAMLPGADNRLLAGAPHVGLAFRREVMAHAWQCALLPDDHGRPEGVSRASADGA